MRRKICFHHVKEVSLNRAATDGHFTSGTVKSKLSEVEGLKTLGSLETFCDLWTGRQT